MSQFKVLVSISVDARDDRHAHEVATELKELLRSPLVRMAVEGKGIRLFDDGRIVVHQPQRE